MYRVLIVEDNPAIQRNLKMLTNKLSDEFEVVGTAINGARALQVLENVEVDIIIADIQMPVMDGLELLGIVKQKNSAIQSIIISGYNEFEYAKTAISLGVNEYILKPVDPDEYVNALHKVSKAVDKVRKQSQTLLNDKELHKILTVDKEKRQIIVEESKKIVRDFSGIISRGDKDKFFKLLSQKLEEWCRNQYSAYAVREFLLTINSLFLNTNKELDGLDILNIVDNILYLSTTYEELEKTTYEFYTALFEKIQMSQKYCTKELYEKIDEILKKNIYGNISIQELADKVSVSPSYINRIFRKYAGVSPMNYYSNMKIEEAKRLLKENADVPIKSVADILCYSDQQHFSKAFKTAVGISPLEYKEKYHNGK